MTDDEPASHPVMASAETTITSAKLTCLISIHSISEKSKLLPSGRANEKRFQLAVPKLEDNRADAATLTVRYRLQNLRNSRAFLDFARAVVGGLKIKSAR